MRVKVLLLSVFITSLIPLNSLAFDGNRKDFMLSLGLGYGQTTIISRYGIGDAIGVGSDFKIGFGLSPKTQLYYSGRSMWNTGRIDAITGLEGVGISYFLEPRSPSMSFQRYWVWATRRAAII